MRKSKATVTKRRLGAGKARYVMVGGFLGAGKTTAVAELARRFKEQGRRVGLITNDQGRNLVDTAMLRANGFATEEIAGGCFCCRFNSLMDASQALARGVKPDVFIAEPVGSCTDLVATVTYPLRRLYGQGFTVAPLSVLVDPVRARRVCELDRGASFSEKVLYIFNKQLEEADLIVISKADLLVAAQLQELEVALRARYPRAEVLTVSVRKNIGVDAWFEKLAAHEQAARPTMEVDYDTYADGEALLGWMNCTARLLGTRAFDANAYLERLAAEIRKRLDANGAEIAHLKMTFSPDGGLNDIAVANLVRNDFVPELSLALEEDVTSGQLIVNLRAEAPPHVLGRAVQEALPAAAKRSPGVTATLDHLEHFRPGRPTPTHRDERKARSRRTVAMER